MLKILTLWPRMYAIGLTNAAMIERQGGNYPRAIAINEEILRLAHRPWRPLRDDLRLLLAYIELFLCHLCLQHYEESIENGCRGFALLTSSADYGWRAFAKTTPANFLGKHIPDTGPAWVTAFLRDLRKVIEAHGSEEARSCLSSIEAILSEMAHS